MRQNKPWKWPLIVGAACAVAIIGYGVFSHSSSSSTQATQVVQKTVSHKATAVVVAKVRSVNWGRQLTTIGTVTTNHSILVAAKTSGLITNTYFHPSQMIQKGQLLFQIDAAKERAAFAEAVVNLKLSKSNLQKYTEIYHRHAMSQAAYEKYVNAYQVDLAQLKQARANLALTKVTAPISGVIGLNQKNTGNYVNTGDVLADLQPLNHKWRIDFSVPGRFLTSIKVGAPLYFSIGNNDAKKYLAKISAINNTIDSGTRNVDVRATVHSKLQLTPGQFVQINLELGNKQKLFAVPSTALSMQGRKQIVYKIMNGRVVSVPIQLKQRREATVGVLGKLTVGDNIVSLGTMKLHDGAAVAIISEGSYK